MIEKSKKIFSNTFTRFLLVGGCSTLIDYILYLTISIKINYSIAKSISITCSCIFSFAMNKSFTFKNEDKTSIKHVFRYIISQIINIGINTGTNAVIYEFTGYKILAMVCATGVAMVINYYLQKKFVFK